MEQQQSNTAANGSETNKIKSKSNEKEIRTDSKRKKWCYYELHTKGSCEYGEKCKFSHQVPENGKHIMEGWFTKQKENIGNSIADLNKWSKGISENASKTNSKIHHFLVNIIKEMISKEMKKISQRFHRN